MRPAEVVGEPDTRFAERDTRLRSRSVKFITLIYTTIAGLLNTSM